LKRKYSYNHPWGNHVVEFLKTSNPWLLEMNIVTSKVYLDNLFKNFLCFDTHTKFSLNLGSIKSWCQKVIYIKLTLNSLKKMHKCIWQFNILKFFNLWTCFRVPNWTLIYIGQCSFPCKSMSHAFHILIIWCEEKFQVVHQ
jgi:hypothetical protein